MATSAYRLALLKRYVSGGHLIEIGAGTGAFCVPARDAGFRISAIEMSAPCCEYLARQRRITGWQERLTGLGQDQKEKEHFQGQTAELTPLGRKLLGIDRWSD